MTGPEPWLGSSVEVMGFEPTASSVRGKRSSGLSYTPMGRHIVAVAATPLEGSRVRRPAPPASCAGAPGRPWR